MIPAKVYLGRNRSFAAGFDDLGKGLSQPQPLQAAGLDDTEKRASRARLTQYNRLKPLPSQGAACCFC